MTWSRYAAIHRHRELNPPVKHLLTCIAADHGYQPPERPKSGEQATTELMAMFPGGVIKGANG